MVGITTKYGELLFFIMFHTHVPGLHTHVLGQQIGLSPGPLPDCKCSKTVKVRC